MMADDDKISESKSGSLVVPIQYAGKWIAWNKQGTRMVTSGETLQEAVQAAAAAGESEPIFAKAPKADVRFVVSNHQIATESSR